MTIVMIQMEDVSFAVFEDGFVRLGGSSKEERRSGAPSSDLLALWCAPSLFGRKSGYAPVRLRRKRFFRSTKGKLAWSTDLGVGNVLRKPARTNGRRVSFTKVSENRFFGSDCAEISVSDCLFGLDGGESKFSRPVGMVSISQDCSVAVRFVSLQSVAAQVEVFVDDVGWAGDSLCFSLTVKRLPTVLFDACEAKIQAVTKDSVVAEAPCYALSQESCTLCSSLDIGLMCGEFDRSVQKDVKFRLLLNLGGGEECEYCSEPFAKNRKADIFSSFVDSFAFSEKAVAIPDESKKGELVIRLLGLSVDPSGLPYAMLKRRPFYNALLLYSLTHGMGSTMAFARAMRDRILETKIIREGDEFFAECRTGQHSLRMPISDLPDTKHVTILDEGKPIEALFENEIHELHFERLWDMLLEFNQLCRKHGLRYYLFYGTLLGAIRHRGFIPWDHDVDLCMPLSDYLKLRKVFDEGGAPDGRALDDFFSVPGYPDSFGRYTDCNTSRVNPFDSRSKGGIGSPGLFLDIFILLPLEGEEDEARKLLTDFLVFDELNCWLKRKFLARDCEFAAALAAAKGKMELIGREAFLEEMRNRFFSQQEEKTRFVATTTSAFKSGELFERKWFEPARHTTIRGVDFPIPGNSYEVLVTTYGVGYRMYPENRTIPVENRIFTSANIPCSAVVNTYFQESAVNEELEARKVKKALQLEESAIRCDIDPQLKLIESLGVEIVVETRINDARIDVDCLASCGDWGSLRLVFLPLYDFVSDSGTKLWAEYPLGLSGRLLAYSLKALLLTGGDLSIAECVVCAINLHAGEAGVEIAEALALYQSIVETRKRFDCGDYRGAIEEAAPIVEKYGCTNEAAVAMVLCKLILRDGKDEEAAVRAALHDLRTWFPSGDIGLYLCAVAMALIGMGRNGEAIAILHHAESCSSDGVALLVAHDLLERSVAA